MDIYTERIKPLFDASRKNGMSDAKMEREIGLPAHSINKWNTGKYRSWKNYLPEISKYFDVSLAYLMGEEDEYGLTDGAWTLMGELFHNERKIRGKSIEDCVDGETITAVELSAFECGDGRITYNQAVVICGLVGGLTPQYVFHGYSDALEGKRWQPSVGDIRAAFFEDYGDDPTPPEKLRSPGVTDDVVSFPVMGTVAAGYDYVIYEDFTDDTVDVARSALRGRPVEDFFVLRVVGHSMHPEYQEGDYILVLKQETLDYYGQTGVVLYDDDKVTLKRVEYSQGKNQMKLVPANSQYPPVTLRDEALEHCRILGVPKLLIREIEE